MNEIPGEKSAGEKKVDEYVARIRGDENNAPQSADDVLKDLPPIFQESIRKKLEEVPVESSAEKPALIVPPQYDGMTAEAVEFIWVIPEYLDLEKTKSEKERKQRAIEYLKKKESTIKVTEERSKEDQRKVDAIAESLGINAPQIVEQKSNPSEESFSRLDLEERRKLNGWSASYELARIARQESINLAELSREEYVQYAILNALAIDDSQLRAAPWQRMGTSPEEIVARNREIRAAIDPEKDRSFARFCFDTKQRAGGDERSIAPGVRIRQGTKDSDSWLFFGINNGSAETASETYKSYLCVRDLNTLTPGRFQSFLEALQVEGYKGDVKIFQDLAEQGTKLNDQIVMHGNSKEESVRAIEIAKRFFGNEIMQLSFGKDEIIDGENQSYSQVLAKKIQDEIQRNT